MIDNWLNQLSNLIQVDAILVVKTIATLLAYLIYWLIRRATERFAQKKFEQPNRRFQFQKTIGIIYNIILVVVIWQVWLPSVTSLVTYLGLLTAGIAIALKDVIANLFGWLFIIWRRLFEVGDRIQIDEIIGDVIDQTLFTFSLMEIRNWVDADQSTGRVVFVPNSKVFSAPLFSYTAGIGGYIWNELPILITFESNWKKAKLEFQTILDNYFIENPIDQNKFITKQKNEKFLVYLGVLTPIVYTSVKESGVLLTMRFLCEPYNRRGVSAQLWEIILSLVDQNEDIALAYPTQRVILNDKHQLGD